MTAEDSFEGSAQSLVTAVELLVDADDRVDLYGMNEREADLYLN